MASRKKAPAGVTEFEFRKMLEKMKKQEIAASSASTTIDAAALQSDLSRRFNLTGSNNPARLISNSNNALVARQRNSNRNPKRCDCCLSYNNFNEEVCTSCGYYLNGAPVVEETLTQRRGIAPMPVKVNNLSEAEWEAIEKNIIERSDPDSCCPICMEGFNQGHEVLLSCSHIFHRACLQSFEKFMKNGVLSCPICRSSNYQKKITHIGSRSFQVVCVKRIQAMWRGCLGRKRFKRQLKQFYRDGRGDEALRKKYYEVEVTSLAQKITKNFDHRSGQVDTMLSSMDRTLSDGKQLDLLFEQMMTNRMQQQHSEDNSSVHRRFDSSFSSDRHYNNAYYDSKHSESVNYSSGSSSAHTEKEDSLDWAEICHAARARGPAGDCAICMFPIVVHVSTATHTHVHLAKKNVILSCTHVFHEHCIANFEKFLNHTIPTCPVCRAEYQRRVYSG